MGRRRTAAASVAGVSGQPSHATETNDASTQQPPHDEAASRTSANQTVTQSSPANAWYSASPSKVGHADREEEKVAKWARRLLRLYARLPLLADDGLTADLHGVLAHRWERLSTHQARCPGIRHPEGLPHFVERNDDPEQSIPDATLSLINYASFVHLVFQLPLEPISDADLSSLAESMRKGTRWMLRDPDELLEAQKGFWRYCSTTQEGQVQSFNQALEAYTSLCVQIAIHRLAHVDQNVENEDGIIKDCFQTESFRQVVTAQKQTVDSQQRRYFDTLIKTFEKRAKRAIEDLKSSSEPPQDRYKYGDMVKQCISYAVALSEAVPEQDNDAPQVTPSTTASRIQGQLVEAGPSAVAGPSVRRELAFTSNYQLKVRRLDDARAQFPKGPVQRHIATEFEEGDVDPFLDRETARTVDQGQKAKKRKRTRGGNDANQAAEMAQDQDASEATWADGGEIEGQSDGKGKERALEDTLQAKDALEIEADSISTPDGHTSSVNEPDGVRNDDADEFEDGLQDEDLSEQRQRYKRLREEQKAKELQQQEEHRRLAREAHGASADDAHPSASPDEQKPLTNRSTSMGNEWEENRPPRKVKESRYKIGQKENGRKAWTEAETLCLMQAMDEIFRSMSQPYQKTSAAIYTRILKAHGPLGTVSRTLAGRNNMQLKDKVRNEIIRMRRDGVELPAWKEILHPNL